jgi:hypothetical protein
MKTIQMTLDEELVIKLDGLAKSNISDITHKGSYKTFSYF